MKKYLYIFYKNILLLPYYLFYSLPKQLYLKAFHFYEIIKVSKKSQRNSLFSPKDRLGQLEIFLALIRWYLKYDEVCYNFYKYGMDKRYNTSKRHYMGYKKFRKFRDGENFNPPVSEDYNYLCLVRDKFVFSQYMSTYSLPVVKDLAIFDQESLRWISTGKKYDIREFFNDKSKHLEGFCKPFDAGQGRGTFLLKLKEGVIYVNDEIVSLTKFLNLIKGKYLLQERIIQHEVMSAIFPYSVNTMRLVTFYNSGDPLLVFGYLRTGTEKNIVDNFKAGGLAISIHLETGKLFEYGYQNLNGKFRLIKNHPNTKFKFKDFEIPYFQEAINSVTKSHKCLYGIHSIGWDVAITPEGPIIIEANDEWDSAMFLNLNFKSKFLQQYITGTNN